MKIYDAMATIFMVMLPLALIGAATVVAFVILGIQYLFS